MVDFNRFQFLILCQNKIYSTKLERNDKRCEAEPVEAKYVNQTSAKICEVFALKFDSLPFVYKIVRRYLSSCKYFYHLPSPTNFRCVLPICERKYG